ncbi:MAG: hypothetical protein Udaeo2_11740 [Candidatus Udaeobacter sp.]|nr:MAG: hypothetical protein Udaeo2_11740 [Candidatus Udaeobacter sp.]
MMLQLGKRKPKELCSLINPEALPALRIAGTFSSNQYSCVHLHLPESPPVFGQDPNVTDDIPAVRKLRVEVVLIPGPF